MRAPAPENVAVRARHPWDNAAQGWNQNAALVHAWLQEATTAMFDAARINLGAHVLDIAAGAGDQTLDIARRVGPCGYVLATDISEGILALAQQNALAAGFQHVYTRVADAQTLHVSSANFDAAVSRLGLMFCQNPQAALQRAHAALKHGGRLSALVFAAPEHNPCLVISLATAYKHAGMTALPSLECNGVGPPGTLMSLGDPALLAQLLNTTGFVAIDVRAIAAPFCLPTAAHYVEFLRTSASPLIEILSPLPRTAQEDAWNDMTAQLSIFTTATGWIGPNTLLLCSASAA